MAWTETEERRIQAIEIKLNEVQIALNQLATKQQLKQLLNIRQSEIDSLETEVALLQQRVTDLENA